MSKKLLKINFKLCYIHSYSAAIFIANYFIVKQLKYFYDLVYTEDYCCAYLHGDKIEEITSLISNALLTKYSLGNKFLGKSEPSSRMN